ncbi:glycosyltransferase family 2 protein [Alicyclobacillus fastidiosus]|uniref:Glycosyltransferase n=1 Tax=Alicyclobacillus fastidiosus TaxID=392011 RepID=A0ABV5AFG5_9BACL|nr:glycosyltransferase family 2 protein [Alicyclobacillus fastidiosus]WEH09632.1 glycosyltransferase [Alicyclobacillus fastidiosus]
MNKPLVTVLIPAYNRAKYVAKAIESVQRQTIDNFLCIVIDDGSEDETRLVVESYAADDLRIRCLTLPENRGLGQALDAGLREVTTPYFTILDSDDWYAEHTLEVCLQAIEQAPQDVSLVCGNAVVWEEQSDGRLTQKDRQPGRAFSDQYDFILYGPTLVPRFLRTKTVLSVGGFERDPITDGRMAEDRLLLLKLIHVSNFIYVDEDLYHIRVHQDNMTKPQTRQKFMEVKRYIFTRMLKEWGDEYEAEFYIHPEGWLDVRSLVPKK